MSCGRSLTPSNTSNRAELLAHAVKRDTSRQQQEEGERDITYMSDEPVIEPPAKDTPPPDGVVGTHSQCDLTQIPTKETLPGIITQIQDGERTQPQELLESGREDTWKDNDGMETGDEFEEMTPDINQWRDSDLLTPGDQKNGTVFTTSNMPPNIE